jgi:hypothetical protein
MPGLPATLPAFHALHFLLQDGAAYLLERRGDVQSALKIYIQNLDRANRNLVEAVQSGKLDLAGAAAAAAAAAAAGAGSSSSGAAGGHASLLRQRRPSAVRPASAAAAAGACAVLLQAPPAEVREAVDALRSAVAMCLR